MTGRCHCEAVQFEVTSDVLAAHHCHCKTCRRIHGTVYATSAMVGADGFRVTAGQESITEYQSSPGKRRCFCSKCGSHVFVLNDNMPGVVVLRVGNLDDGHGIEPKCHYYTSEKEPWYEILDSLPHIAEL